MSPRAKAIYTVVIVLLLLACVGINFWPGITPAPMACQTNASGGS
jgi:hypothetical protein